MYPVTYEADNPGDGRNRLTTFFRGIVAIPWFIVAALYGLGAGFAIVIAWFALVFTGRYPDGLYNFVAGYVRMASRVNAFYYLATDEWPPFNGEEDPSYPVRIGIPPPKAEYSRLKAGLRIIVGIPVMLLAWVQSLIANVIGIIGWFAILFTGNLSEGLFNPLRSALAYQARATAYFGLLTEDYPPFSLEESSAGSAAAAPPPPPPPVPPDAGTPQ
jgi:Domain of unknown function (DUF4389)